MEIFVDYYIVLGALKFYILLMIVEKFLLLFLEGVMLWRPEPPLLFALYGEMLLILPEPKFLLNFLEEFLDLLARVLRS